MNVLIAGDSFAAEWPGTNGWVKLLAKDYDVTNLPGASKVVYGFWKTPNKVPADYEIRIYLSHEDAVNIGVKYAKERSGETALLDESEASWKEGLKESRFCSLSVLRPESNMETAAMVTICGPGWRSSPRRVIALWRPLSPLVSRVSNCEI
mgnify:CR=1 FL=1